MSGEADHIFVVGAGGAGLIAAWRCALAGARVALLERNAKPGIKLLISGGGKCNITHEGPIEDVLKAFLPREARFLKPSFYRFGNKEIVDLLEGGGVKTYVRPNGRVFPSSGFAADVVQALVDSCVRSGVELKLGVYVESVQRDETGVTGLIVDGRLFPSRHVVLATGGISYPRTGTTGDGIRWARELGHTIVPLRPALAPIGVDPPLPKEWRGIAIRDGCLALIAGGKQTARWCDDILISHEGISGPAALEVSRTAAELLEQGEALLQFDFFPQSEFIELDRRLNETVRSQRGKMIGTVLEAWLPNRLVEPLLRSAGIDPSQRGHTLTAADRKEIVHLLKKWTIGRVSGVKVERGEVTAGGVSLDEVDPHSMRSRRVAGLYLCGEMLDIAGPVGGYNLQAAFSTGFVAGESAARDVLSREEIS